MLNIADRPPSPGAGLAELLKVLGYAAVVIAFTLVTFILTIPALLCGLHLSRHLSPEAAAWLAVAGSFIAGFMTCRILSRRCRWA